MSRVVGDRPSSGHRSFILGGQAVINGISSVARPEAGRSLRMLMTTDAIGGVVPYSSDLAAALRSRGSHTMLAVLGPTPAMAQRHEARRAGVPLVEHACRLEWMDDAEQEVAMAGDWLLSLERALCPDVLHLNGYSHGALPWRSPVLVVAHSCVRTWWKAVKGGAVPARYDGYTSAVVAGLNRASAVVAPTGAMLSALTREYPLTVPSHVVPNGCAELTPRAPRVTWPKSPMVLTAGRAW